MRRITRPGSGDVSDQTDLSGQGRHSEIGYLHEIGSRFAAAESLETVLNRVVHVVSSVVQCDSCFIYVLEDDQLVLRASKEPRRDFVNRLKLRVGQGITGWVAEHRQPVVVGCHAFEDPRFQVFNELPEDHYEAFLSVPVLCRGRLVAVINLQHRFPHEHSWAEIQLVATIGFLVGAEIQLARLESENTQLSERLETRKLVERAKGILQRDLGISEQEAYLAIQRQSGIAAARSGTSPKRSCWPTICAAAATARAEEKPCQGRREKGEGRRENLTPDATRWLDRAERREWLESRRPAGRPQ
jgi:uroporphyrinogen-III synthase